MSPNDSTISELEHAVLAALCGAGLAPDARNHANRALSKYDWTVPDHRVIYEALQRMNSCTAGEIRAQLKADLTRLGFPDIEWELYFETPAIGAVDTDTLIRKLLEWSPQN